MELLAGSFAAITWRYPDGSSFETQRKVIRTRGVSWEDSPAVLRGLLQSDDGAVSFHT
jgi:hypothetical protein